MRFRRLCLAALRRDLSPPALAHVSESANEHRGLHTGVFLDQSAHPFRRRDAFGFRLCFDGAELRVRQTDGKSL